MTCFTFFPRSLPEAITALSISPINMWYNLLYYKTNGMKLYTLRLISDIFILKKKHKPSKAQQNIYVLKYCVFAALNMNLYLR